jgi:hypothetical protein
VAEQVGVDKTSIFNWESNVAKPKGQYMPLSFASWATTLYPRLRPQPSSWSGAAPRWACRRKTRQRSCTSIRARWRNGNVASANRLASCWAGPDIFSNTKQRHSGRYGGLDEAHRRTSGQSSEAAEPDMLPASRRPFGHCVRKNCDDSCSVDRSLPTASCRSCPAGRQEPEP